MSPGTHGFSSVVTLARWLVDEGLLDDAWVEAVHPDEGRVELLLQLITDPPPGTARGDHRWWSQRTTDDVLPWTLTGGAVTGEGRGRIVGYRYEPDGDAPTGLRLELERGESLRIPSAEWRVDVHAIRRGVPRLG